MREAILCRSRDAPDGTLAAYCSHTRRSLPKRPAQIAGPRQVGPTRLAVERAPAAGSCSRWQAATFCKDLTQVLDVRKLVFSRNGFDGPAAFIFSTTASRRPHRLLQQRARTDLSSLLHNSGRDFAAERMPRPPRPGARGEPQLRGVRELRGLLRAWFGTVLTGVRSAGCISVSPHTPPFRSLPSEGNTRRAFF